MRQVCGALGLAAFLSVAGPQSANAVELTDEQLAAIAQSAIRPNGAVFEEVLAAVARSVRTYDLAKDGLDEADLARARQTRDARLRGPVLGALLASDLDGNQRVTREEYEIAGRSSPVRALMGLNFVANPLLQDPFDLRDDNRDEVLTWDEMSKIRPQDVRGSDPTFEIVAFLLEVDPTPDERFTVSDARSLAEIAFSRLDQNGDGTLAPDEVSHFTRLASKARVKVKLGPNPN